MTNTTEAVPIASYEGTAGGEKQNWRLLCTGYGLLLECGGYLTNGIDPDFQERANAAIEECRGQGLLVDLSGCLSITSTSFGSLIQFYNLARDRGMEVVAVRPVRAVERLLGILGVNELFRFVDDREDGARRLDGAGA